MAKTGEMVGATVTAVHPPIRVTPFSKRPGYCTVECEWGEYNLMDGSVQQVHPEDRVVGRTGFLIWIEKGSYSGPAWQRRGHDEG